MKSSLWLRFCLLPNRLGSWFATVILVGIVSFGLATHSLAQVPTIAWQRALGGSEHDDAHAITATPDGGVVVAGRTSSNNGDVSGKHGGSDVWVLRLNSSGSIVWQRALGGGGFDHAYSATATADGGFVVAGYTDSNDGDVSGHHGGADFWVVKLSSLGDIVWQKALGGSNSDIARAITATSDGGVVVAGYTESNNGDVSGNHGGNDAWVVRLNSSGSIVWQRALGGSNIDIVHAITATSDGGFVVAGYTNSNNGDVSGLHGSFDAWVVRLTSAGAIVWQKALGGSALDEATAITATSDGGFVLAGRTESNDGDVSGNHGLFDFWVVKLTSSGNIVWQKTLGGSNNDIANAIIATADEGFVVAGYTNSNNGDVSGNRGDYDVWVVKLNSSGNLVWQKTLGGTKFDIAQAITTTTDGGLAVAGYTYSNDGDVSGYHPASGFYPQPDFWVVKLTEPSQRLQLLEPLYNCTTGQITFRTAGGNGNPVEFHAPVLTQGWTSQTSFVIQPKHRNKAFKIRARQRNVIGDGWDVVEIDFNPAAVCAGMRIGLPESTIDLSARVLDNPVQSQHIDVEVQGAEGQSLQLQVRDMQGRVVSSQHIDKAAMVERQRIPINGSAGPMLLLKVSTATQEKTLRVLKAY